MLPAGPLREPAARLQGVDALAIYGSGRRVGDDSLMSFAITLGAERFVNLHSGQQLDLGGFLALAGGKPLQAVAGIARPERFFAHLHRLGLRTIDHPFADHHAFSAADLAFAEHDLLLMTEKDAVKCASFAHPGWWVLQVDALLPAAFYELILRRLGQLPGTQKALNPRKKSHEP
jgi:tetraacyldisaccharide 4'-kinase